VLAAGGGLSVGGVVPWSPFKVLTYRFLLIHWDLVWQYPLA